MRNREKEDTTLDTTLGEGGHLLGNLVLFGRIAKQLGLAVTPERMTLAGRALGWIRLERKSDVYHTLRSLMVTRFSDIALFDEAFKLFWQKPSVGTTGLDLRSLGEQRHKRKTQFEPAPDGIDGERDQDDPGRLLLTGYSAGEVLRRKDFAEMTARELEAARRWIERFAGSLSQRRSRRRIASRRGSPALRSALRRSLKRGGEMIELPRFGPRLKPRPLVLICDISGSMESYTRILLHFAHAVTTRLGRVESFVFSTRLTRITRPLRLQSIDRALRDVSSTVRDWAGGTQIGGALHAFNFKWSRRVLGWGAVVLLVTDGWDRGDPEWVRREAARLRRSSTRLIWLNPLVGAPQYAPLTRGAQALLPNVDRLLSVRNLASLEELGRELSRLEFDGYGRVASRSHGETERVRP